QAHDSGSLFAVIAVRDEGHWRDRRLEKLAALPEFQLGALRAERRGDIAHGDRPLQRRREGSACHPANFIALAVQHQSALAHWLATLDSEADALLDRAILDLGDDPHVAGKAALGAAALADRGLEVGPDRRRLGVEVVPIARI